MIQYPFQVWRTVVRSRPNLHIVCDKMIRRSMWFEVMPLPDDEWQVTVKNENAHFIVTEASRTLPSVNA